MYMLLSWFGDIPHCFPEKRDRFEARMVVFLWISWRCGRKERDLSKVTPKIFRCFVCCSEWGPSLMSGGRALYLGPKVKYLHFPLENVI